MTQDQADQIIDFLYGILRPPDKQETRRAWRLQLAPLDAELASRAAINGGQVWEHFPSWPLFHAEYRALKRAARAPDPADVCPTCKGDLAVVVALRYDTDSREPGMEVEEYAPCPDCNANADTSFRRPDGSLVQSPDPYRVREMLSS